MLHAGLIKGIHLVKQPQQGHLEFKEHKKCPQTSGIHFGHFNGHMRAFTFSEGADGAAIGSVDHLAEFFTVQKIEFLGEQVSDIRIGGVFEEAQKNKKFVVGSVAVKLQLGVLIGRAQGI